MEASASSSFSWRESVDGHWRRPLTASEDRWDSFHRDTPHAWTDFCAAVFFNVKTGPYRNSKQPEAITAWAHKSIAQVLLTAPLLMATIENSGQEKLYDYKTLASLEDLQSRAESLTTVGFVDNVRAAVDQMANAFYSSRDRVSVELGPALIRFVFICGPSGQYAVFLQTTHTMIDFWALASLDELILDTLSRDEPLPASLEHGRDTAQLSPSYLEVLKEPLSESDYHNPTEQDRKHAASIMEALLANPLGLRIEKATKEAEGDAKADLDSMIVHHTFTSEQTLNLVSQAKKHGQSVNQVIQTAHIAALQIVSPVAEKSQVRTHAPSGIINVLPRTTLLDGEKPTGGALTPTRQPFMGSVMVPYVCDIGPLLDVSDLSNASSARSDAFWQVASEIGQNYEQCAVTRTPLKAFWDKGPALWGGFVEMLPAVYAGAMPGPPAVYPPLSNAGVLDADRHLRAGNMYRSPGSETSLELTDLAFYPRVSPLFGAMSWAWTLAGKLHTQACLPDPRVAQTPDARTWFATSNDLLAQVASDSL